MSQKKTIMTEEGKGEVAVAAYTYEPRGHRGVEDTEVVGTQIRQFLPLEITPEPFDGVELGGVPREPLDGEPAVLLGQVGDHGRALVVGMVPGLAPAGR